MSIAGSTCGYIWMREFFVTRGCASVSVCVCVLGRITV